MLLYVHVSYLTNFPAISDAPLPVSCTPMPGKAAPTSLQSNAGIPSRWPHECRICIDSGHLSHLHVDIVIPSVTSTQFPARPDTHHCHSRSAQEPAFEPRVHPLHISPT
jgi:hypothetical protein